MKADQWTLIFSSIALADGSFHPKLVAIVVAFSVTNEIKVHVLHPVFVLCEAGVNWMGAAWLMSAAAACGVCHQLSRCGQAPVQFLIAR
jgi:hypothetical protein